MDGNDEKKMYIDLFSNFKRQFKDIKLQKQKTSGKNIVCDSKKKAKQMLHVLYRVEKNGKEVTENYKGENICILNVANMSEEGFCIYICETRDILKTLFFLLLLLLHSNKRQF